MILVFFLGLTFAFIGYTPPSVLNMTALKIRLDSNQREFTKFSLGVSLIVFIQVSLSVFLTDYFNRNSEFLVILEKTGILILIGLSIYFFQKNKKEKKKQDLVKSTKNLFLRGMILSLLNMFAIPFFCAVIAMLTNLSLMNFDVISIFLFVIGAAFGAYCILYLYAKNATYIQQKTGNMTQNIHLILSYITAGFALFTFLKFVV